MSKLTLTLPGSSEQLAAPSGVPQAWQGDVTTTGASVFQTASNLIFMVAGFLALLMVIYSGIQWITSGGDVDKIASAKKRLKYAIIGLVVVVASFFIVTTVVRILGGDPTRVLSPGSTLSR